jgi:uncharacterized protein with gpF-like domain
VAIRRKQKTLRPVLANAGIAASYRRKLRAVIQEMADEYEAALTEQYEDKPPVMARDATPARDLDRELRRLGDRWRKRINAAAPKLADWFRRAAQNRSDAALRKILRDAGMTVRFQMTAGMRDVVDAVVAQQVALIKSIPEQYHSQVSGLVQRSVTEGRDLSFLSRELRDRYGITQRRANFISLDQNQKATTALRRVRELDLGLEKEDEKNGIWLHSHAGKNPRPTHVKQHGKRFSVRNGWRDPATGKIIWPGTEPGCRCSWRIAVRGFS